VTFDFEKRKGGQKEKGVKKGVRQTLLLFCGLHTMVASLWPESRGIPAWNSGDSIPHFTTVAFEGAPVMLALSPVEGKAAAPGNGDVQLAGMLNGCCRARLENQLADIGALIQSELNKVALADRPQRRVFDSSILNPRSSIVEIPANLYLAMLSDGKLKPFATTGTVSQSTGVSEALADNPKPVLSEVEVSGNDPITPHSSPLTSDDLKVGGRCQTCLD